MGWKPLTYGFHPGKRQIADRAAAHPLLFRNLCAPVRTSSAARADEVRCATALPDG